MNNDCGIYITTYNCQVPSHISEARFGLCGRLAHVVANIWNEARNISERRWKGRTMTNLTGDNQTSSLLTWYCAKHFSGEIYSRATFRWNGFALAIVNFSAGSFSLCFNSLVLYVFFKNRLLREVSHNWKTLVKMNLRASPIQPRCSSLGCFSSTTPIFINHFHILNGHFIW